MIVLVINTGSSSLKFQIIDTIKKETLYKGVIDRIGQRIGTFTGITTKGKKRRLVMVNTHAHAIKTLLKKIEKHNVLEEKKIEAVAHRVVHGGEKYCQTTRIDRKVLREIKKLNTLAPLHNPVNLEGIKGARKHLKHVPHYAVFDTAFFTTLPEKAYRYAIPEKLYKKHSIRRYGFHGTSHKFVTQQALHVLKKKKAKLISCHLGNGCSITATINGKAVDTSMGFTPLEGLIMGTRSGDLDPALPLLIMKILKFNAKQTDNLLNTQSGLKALFGKSDMRDVLKAEQQGNTKAKQTIQIFCYRIAKYIGAYAAAMNGVEGIIFTGGIGENSFLVRKTVCSNLDYLGVKIDNTKNQKNEQRFEKKGTKVKLMIIPTNEELQMAMEVHRAVKKETQARS